MSKFSSFTSLIWGAMYRYDLKSEFLTLDETWPGCHWQEPHRGNVCEMLALRHPDPSQIFPWCVMKLGMRLGMKCAARLSFPNAIKVVTGKGTINWNFLITHSTSTLWKTLTSSLQNLPIGNCRSKVRHGDACLESQGWEGNDQWIPGASSIASLD